MQYSTRTFIFSLFCVISRTLVPMEQHIPPLPNDIWRLILETDLPGENRLLNTLVRHFGLTPLTADKIIKAYMERTHLYAYNEEAVQTMLTSFKTARSGITLTKDIQAALTRYRSKYPLYMMLHARYLYLFRSLALNYFPCFDPQAYFKDCQKSPLPAQDVNWATLLRNLEFRSVEHAETVRAQLVDYCTEMHMCIELIEKRIRGHKTSERLKDDLLTVYAPAALTALGATANIVHSMIDKEPYLHESYYLGLLVTLLYTASRTAYIYGKVKQRTGNYPGYPLPVTFSLLSAGGSLVSPYIAAHPLVTPVWGSAVGLMINLTFIQGIRNLKAGCSFDPVLDPQNPLAYPALLSNMKRGLRCLQDTITTIDEYLAYSLQSERTAHDIRRT